MYRINFVTYGIYKLFNIPVPINSGGALWRAGYIPTDRQTSWGVLHHPCTVPVYKLLSIRQYVNQCCRTSCCAYFHSTHLAGFFEDDMSPWGLSVNTFNGSAT